MRSGPGCAAPHAQTGPCPSMAVFVKAAFIKKKETRSIARSVQLEAKHPGASFGASFGSGEGERSDDSGGTAT